MNHIQDSHLFRLVQLRRPELRQDTSSQGKSAVDDEKGLYCSACATHITDQNQAISVNGSHQHAFFNPAGIAFEIRCFQTAPGVFSFSAPSDVFSWFPGFSWQIALCSHCRIHLGWRFSNATEQKFYGLIAARLQSQ
ncbi:MAG: cereblon family protein [Desulfobulbus sp.]